MSDACGLMEDELKRRLEGEELDIAAADAKVLQDYYEKLYADMAIEDKYQMINTKEEVDEIPIIGKVQREFKTGKDRNIPKADIIDVVSVVRNDDVYSVYYKLKDSINKVDISVTTGKATNKNSSTILNLENVRQAYSDKLQKEKKAREAAKKQRDVYRDAWIDPTRFAEGIIERQNNYIAKWMDVVGGSLIDLAKPVVVKGDQALRDRSELYVKTINAIRHGFIDSAFAQKMQQTIGTPSDINEKLLNTLVHLGNNASEETMEILTTQLKHMDDRVNKLYTDNNDRIKLYKIFAKSGIAGISNDPMIAKGIIDGKLSVDEAIKIVESTMNKDDIVRVRELAEYYTNGVTKDGTTNVKLAGLIGSNAEILVPLYVIKDSQASELLANMDKELRKDLYLMALNVKALNGEINLQEAGYNSSIADSSAMYDAGYDGHYSMDVYTKGHDFKLITGLELKNSKYSEEAGWKVVREPSGGKLGIIAREIIDTGNTPGVGINKNKFNNHVPLTHEDNIKMRKFLHSMKDPKEYISTNQIVDHMDGSYSIILTEQEKIDKLGMMQSVAHSLYRTYAHNKELVATQAVRNLVMHEATGQITTEEELYKLEDTLQRNTEKGVLAEDKEEVPMFLNITYPYSSYDSLPPLIRRYYMTPDKITTHNGMNTKITLVRKSVKDVLLGHPNFSMFKNVSRTLHKYEVGWRELVLLAKQKMTIVSPGKLMMDLVSNLGVLAARDVTMVEMYKGFKEGFEDYESFSRMRSRIVELELRARSGDNTAQVLLDKAKKDLQNMPFYDAFKAGFIQSFSTSLMVKDFDTISGLQKHIDDIVEDITKDSKGSPNELYRAIKWWQSFGASNGFTVDNLLEIASKISIIKGTRLSEEMIDMSKRLKDKKDADSVSRYVTDLIGGPASEAVMVGGTIMVTVDALSKYTLAKSLINRTNPKTKKKYTREEAYIDANNTFIDYRKNIPSEIKALSDYGILMFPAFWLKAQKVILGLVRYHPSTAISSYMIADALNVSSASFLDVNIVNKLANGTVFHNPANLIDWDMVSPWL